MLYNDTSMKIVTFERPEIGTKNEFVSTKVRKAMYSNPVGRPTKL